jgi:hypothetical protein
MSIPTDIIDQEQASGGIGALPVHADDSAPGIEYRLVIINGERYMATRPAYWPGGLEKWDLVHVPRK